MAASEIVKQDLHRVQTCGGDTPHKMRVQGYARDGVRPPGLDCERPLAVACASCDHRAYWPCQGHRESRCRPCARRYRRRVREVASSGLGRDAGLLGMLTLTAPGDRAHRRRDGSWCPCTPVGGVDLGEWNASHSRRWNHLRTALRREFPGLQFFRGIEVQSRGALHDHAMVWIPNTQMVSLVKLRELAMRAGFGHSVDFAPCKPGSKKAAYYVAKYVTKATDSRADVPWAAWVVDESTGEVSRRTVPGRYRTWSMSREWGLSMRQVRTRAAAYAVLKRDQADAAEDARVLAVLGEVLGVVTVLPAAASP